MKARLFFPCLLLAGLLAQSLSAQDLTPSQWPHLKGYWTFQDQGKLTKATVGNDLALVGSHQHLGGPSLYDTAVRITIGNYYKCLHNMAPNGGGDSVNRYTLMFDFRILSLQKWHTFFQTDTTNKNDGECFIRPVNSATPGAIGVGATGYSYDRVKPNTWYRLVISVNHGHFYRYYLNGKLLHEGDTQEVDGRFALTPQLLLFADENQEDDTMDIASVAVFDTCLSQADAARLGTIDPCARNPMTLSLGTDTVICGDNILSKSLGYGYTYKWSTGDTSSTVSFSMKKHGSGQKTIWVKKTDVNNCVLLDTFVLGIYNTPPLNLGKDTGFCEGQKLRITAGSAGGNSFVWTMLPAGSIVSKINNFTIDTTGSYAVLMTNQFGCSSTDTIQVTVFSLPPKPAVATSDKDICQGDTAVISGPAGYKTYIWSNGQNTPSISIQQSETVSLKVRDYNGCESPFSDDMQITMHNNPEAPELKFFPDTSACEGDSIIVSVQGAASSYLWNDGQGPAVRNIKASGSFYVTIKDQMGCQSPVSDTLNITFNPRPAKPVIELMGLLNQCLGDSVTLRCKDSSAHYEWSNNGIEKHMVSTSTETFRVRLRNRFECRGEWSDSITVLFHSIPPRPEVQTLGQDSLTCSIHAKRYQWIIDGNTGDDTMKSVKGIDKASFMVKTGSDYCWSQPSESFIFEKSSIEPTLTSRIMFRISPNPADEVIKLQMVNLRGNSTVAIRISDLPGKMVLDLNTDPDKIKSGLELDLGHWPAGMYFVRVSTLQGVYTARFMLR